MPRAARSSEQELPQEIRAHVECSVRGAAAIRTPTRPMKTRKIDAPSLLRFISWALPSNSHCWRQCVAQDTSVRALFLQRQAVHPLGLELPRESKRPAKPHRPRWGTLSQNGYGDSEALEKHADLILRTLFSSLVES